MSTSSARPDDLDRFAAGSRDADDQLRTHNGRLLDAYETFRHSLGWGVFDADDLLRAFATYIDYNETDAQWVRHIALAFRHAGGDGQIGWLPDAAIAASLKAAGLDRGRRAITFDSPIAYGFPPTTGYVNDPVNTASGNFVALEGDLAFTARLGDLRFARVYNSRSDREGAFGRGWSSWADVRLRAQEDGVEYAGPDGQRAVFARLGDGYGRVAGVPAALRRDGDGHVLEWRDGRRWEFDDAGLPSRLVSGPGTEVRLGYDGGRLVELAHDVARVALTWDGERIVRADASDGRAVGYAYADDGVLVATERRAGGRAYGVDADGRVASVTDADAVEQVRNRYDAEGRVLEQLSPFGRVTLFAYLPGRITVTGEGPESPANTWMHDEAGRLVGVIDGHGRRFSMNYDAWGNPVAVTERGGAVTVQEWDERSRLTRRTLPTGAVLEYGYDDLDRPVRLSTSAGGEATARYDGEERTPSEIVDAEGGVTRVRVEEGLVREVTDPDGVGVRLDYDAAGRVVAAVDGDGGVARLEYDDAGEPLAVVSPLGRRTEYRRDETTVARIDPAGRRWSAEHSAAGRLLAVVDPAGGRTELGYGAHGAPARLRDPVGRETRWGYDAFGNVVSVVAAGGAEWRLEHDAVMRLTGVTDPSGGIWQRGYDADGTLVSAVDPTGAGVTATVDQAGRVTGIDDGATSVSLELDEHGRVVAQRRADGSTSRASYDRCGRVTSVEGPTGAVTRYEYTPAGRLSRLVFPSGREERYAYDRCGRLAGRTDGAGAQWTFTYDADGALTERVGPGGEAERLAYDGSGLLVRREGPGGAAVSFTYDVAGRLATRTAGDGTRRFEYDAAGRLVAASDALGAVTRFEYDGRGLLAGVTDPLGATIRYEHDDAGRLERLVDGLGRTTTFAYDAAGRLTDRIDGSGRHVRWSYDPAGRLAAIGAAGEPPVVIERDAVARVIGVREPGGFEHAFRWDAAGRLVERRRDGSTVGWVRDDDGLCTRIGNPDGTATALPRDGRGLVAAIEHPTLAPITLERDAAGRITGASGEGLRARWEYERGRLVAYEMDNEAGRAAVRLARDAWGRVTSAASEDGPTRYEYDAAGRLAVARTPRGDWTFAYDAGGRLAREEGPDGAVAYEYDAAGQLVSRTGPRGVTRFEHDGAGRRIAERREDGAVTYRWDALGRLSEVEATAAGGPEPARTRVTVDALGELAAVDGAELLWDTADPVPRPLWIDGAAVVGEGAPLATARERDAQWLLPDWQGTVGAPRDPWGAPAAAGGPALGFRGEVELLGHVWLRHRLYAPADRGFLTPDPWPAVPGAAWGASPFHYAGDDPVNLVDPLGLRPVTDAELQEYRDGFGRNVWQHGADWLEDNYEYVIAGALIVGGIALMATGVGGPAGVALTMAGGGLISAGASAAGQKAFTGHVDAGEVVRDGLIGALTTGVGLGVGAAIGHGAKLVPWLGRHPYVAAGVEKGGDQVVSGMVDRGLHGEPVLDPKGVVIDLGVGAVVGPAGQRIDGPVPPGAGADPPRVRLDDPSVDAIPQVDPPRPGPSLERRLFEAEVGAGKTAIEAGERAAERSRDATGSR